jgi:hypothetical protein
MKSPRGVALVLVACLAGCGASFKEGRPSSAGREGRVAGKTPPPATTPELDPDNVEARFGFAEAKARREELARRRQAEAQRVDLVDRKAKRGAPAAPPAESPPPPATCCLPGD